MNDRPAVLYSPLVVLGLAIAFAGAFELRLPATTAWLATTIAYWLLLGFAIVVLGGYESYGRWFARSRGAIGWRLLSAVPAAAVAIPFFAGGFHLLAVGAGAWVIWAFNLVVNPLYAEVYYRSTLMDAAAGEGWRPATAIAVSAGSAAIGQGLIVAINAGLTAGIVAFVATAVSGAFWAVSYMKSGSVRWPVAMHVVVNGIVGAAYLGIIPSPLSHGALPFLL